MEDIDVDHWRNLQELLIASAKESSRIVVIHDQGTVLKCTHSDRSEINDTPERVDDPHEVARSLFEANRGSVDFVAVFERNGFDSYFAQVQDEWSPDEELDEYVRRAYDTLDLYAEAMVTYPKPASKQLGLQWKVGASYEDVGDAIGRFAKANSTCVLGAFAGDELWTTMVLGFDEDKKIDILTTVDSSMLTLSKSRRDLAAEISEWVSNTYRPCSLSVFTDVEGARGFLDASDKGEVLRALKEEDRLVLDRLPDGLEQLL